MSPGIGDHLLVVLFFVAIPLWEGFELPRTIARAGGEPHLRVRVWRRIMIVLWAAGAAAVALWLAAGRPLAALGLGAGHGPGLRVGLGALLVAAAAFGFVRQIRGAATDPRARAKIAAGVAPVAGFVPHDRRELAEFVALSFTAAVCEEILFRGYLVRYLETWMPAVAAVLLSVVLFGLAHAYQGPAGALRAGGVGLVFAGLVALTGSLWLAMLLHLIIDVAGGILSWIAVPGSTFAGPSARGSVSGPG